MFETMRVMIDEWRQEREDRKFRDGFEWAMGEFFIEDASIEEIEALVGDDDPWSFEDGAMQALSMIDAHRDADGESSPVGVQQISILYRMARLLRNTDGFHPSTSGPKAGQLLGELRRLDCSRYDREVM